ncbi:hypothetical protein [Arenimonas sp.]|uniref:hypothetical protein n=1 Tax=Arenimonas sp. TaxID=1872635 RepID=UPI0039E21B6A
MSARPHLTLVHSLPAHPAETEEDRAREERIAQIGRELNKAERAGPMGVNRCMQLWEQLKAEHAARSPEQVKRMEKARGLIP